VIERKEEWLEAGDWGLGIGSWRLMAGRCRLIKGALNSKL